MNGALWVLLLSGILGFRVGLVGFPDWQVAVESAQAVAGLVHYPPDNIFYIYHIKLWTLMHQVLALALVAGAKELSLSLFISGIQGMLTFQALAMFVYALSGHGLLSVGAAALIFFTRSAEYGVVYPIYLLGTEHTYGVIGLSLSVLIVGILGAGWYRTGAILLGMAPAIHPSLGVWTGAIVALAILSDFRRFRDELRPVLPWFLAGCAVTVLSLLIQFTLVYKAPHEMARMSPQDLSAFVRAWDGHRAAVNLWHDGVLLNGGSLVVASLWLVFFSADLPRSSQFLLRICVAAALFALALIPLSWIPPERLPTALLVLMPGRFLNFSAMTFAAMLIGLSGSRRELWARVVLLVLTFGLLVTDHSMLWEFLEHHHDIHYQSAVRPLPLMWFAAAATIAGAAWMRWRAMTHPDGRANRLRHGMYVAEVAVLVLVVVMTLHQSLPQSGAHFLDRTNDVFFADVASRPGMMVLAGDLRLIQLRTRRPVLVDSGALDTVMYSLETGAAMQRIMRDVYGLDMFHPPPDAVGSGRIPPLAHRRVWESYSPEKWRRIRHDFGVTQVLAYADWSLQLPVAAQSRRLLLYDIPER